ncbi:hypothetical protein NEUTE1DRAFT_139481 [Neurospora tetrasperma FGSC 2508]|uniref:Uncharacterized protein n=1 Tax=Neurospora tetrasperma (strain FGSC 2508 / ATCC MYA-4615 / P0657) TaxID=510951 RepID=F8MT78_NEUT8|nr:uncharacterized protein NEUTE1DRAFT_139481 [Neurospora tetrasperma FGSC 2508]EGO55210.1 hypothetical protein NEUTE1DRAFT_139481 [Neurospora tetrasperma FGSC 2508]EGZ69574.1 hypothetical protein NEUTE2DRAFT_141137 [Neurospora tetrasperma FGSC 2509]
MFSTTLAGWRPVVRIVRGTEQPTPYTTCLSLHYLQAWLRKSLRIWPPGATGGVYKDVGHGENNITGFTLPPGIKVATGAARYAMCRFEEVFGQDADVSRPERRLEANEAARLELETSEKNGAALRELGEAGRTLRERETTLIFRSEWMGGGGARESPGVFMEGEGV